MPMIDVYAASGTLADTGRFRLITTLLSSPLAHGSSQLSA
jgi:hypothetical protein